ncbi:SDR family oxidoreductase [Dyadobacter subterraneus]|uniref:SDR family oxidoreductase n=1 Tax=Dyadobacter subterraneus TaxID=2773304 RepID=A0ABR9WE75_9BACT|nr:SDR family oxidoreductase [Dyadobacter subterraneus]MBE9462514.1 SDR family oxidoreductase [Dyadobacter subterraneus]
MKILLTGATGYIGKRLLPVLLENGHEVICCVRDKGRFTPPENSENQVTVIEVDFLNPGTLKEIPENVDGAYYLIHSMSSDSKDFAKLEDQSAENFRNRMNQTEVKHIVYLSGIINDHNLSKHLASRKKVEDILAAGKYHFTTLRAGIIIGSGSASFEIIRDLIEKLPVMITPKWLQTKSQPIAIRDVITMLEKVLFNKDTFGKSFDIGGPDILTYKQMLLAFAAIRNLKRFIITLPVLTPKLSSYWLYFVTSTTFSLAKKLVDSMTVEVVCRDNRLSELLHLKPMSYKEAIEAAFTKIEQNAIISSWKDSLISGRINTRLSQYVQVPVDGCFKDIKKFPIHDVQTVQSRIWKIGGQTGWYYATWLWQLRGYFDKLAGGVGMRRGRTSAIDIHSGDTLDFWRVLLADKKQGRLLLFAEMKLPGEAWLEFSINGQELTQTATFRPKGLYGRLYWYFSMPFHFFIFKGMITAITK